MLKIVKQTILPILFLIANLNCIGQKKLVPEFTVTSISKNVYSIVSPNLGLPTPENKGWNSNSHFIITEKGVLVFDTGSSEAIGKKIKNTIKSITNKPIRWVVNSHSHADHWLGNAAFSNAEIITSTYELSFMKKYGKEDVTFFSKITKGTIGATQLLYPTKLITQNQQLNFGGTDIEFIFSNDAHSKGDLLMWLPKQKIILGGDVLSSDWMPIITNSKNVQILINTLKKIRDLQPSIVLTGHGKATTVESITRDINLLSGVLSFVKEEKQKGEKLSNAILTIKSKIGSKYRSLYKNFDSEIERYVKMLYKIHP